MGFTYTLPLNSDNLLKFWNTFHMDWFGLNTITFTIYIVQYDWWLDPGHVTPPGGNTPRVDFGVVTVTPPKSTRGVSPLGGVT